MIENGLAYRQHRARIVEARRIERVPEALMRVEETMHGGVGRQARGGARVSALEIAFAERPPASLGQRASCGGLPHVPSQMGPDRADIVRRLAHGAVLEIEQHETPVRHQNVVAVEIAMDEASWRRRP